MQKFIITVTAENFEILDDDKAQCFILSDTLSAAFVQEFTASARRKNKLVLADSTVVYGKGAFDGIIFDFSKSENIAKDYVQAVKAYSGKIIGAICRGRRHEAMLLSECEPDFIIFKAWEAGVEKIRELTDWYNEFFLIQSAVMPVDENLDFSAFKTDFVIINDIKYKNYVAKL